MYLTLKLYYVMAIVPYTLMIHMLLWYVYHIKQPMHCVCENWSGSRISQFNIGQLGKASMSTLDVWYINIFVCVVG